jgi:hypothetical protein
MTKKYFIYITKKIKTKCLLDFICLAALKAADVGEATALFNLNTRAT